MSLISQQEIRKARKKITPPKTTTLTYLKKNGIVHNKTGKYRQKSVNFFHIFDLRVFVRTTIRQFSSIQPMADERIGQRRPFYRLLHDRQSLCESAPSRWTTFVVWLTNEKYEKPEHQQTGGNKISIKKGHFLLDVHDKTECNQSTDVCEPVKPTEKSLKITMTDSFSILGYF